MIAKSELQRWLDKLPADSGISIDSGGLCLLSQCGEYIEVGGEPEYDDDE